VLSICIGLVDHVCGKTLITRAGRPVFRWPRNFLAGPR